MILGDCLSSGRPEIMRVSRALQNDGQAIIFQNAVYRMRFDGARWRDHNGQRPSHNTFQRIQDFDIMIDMTDSDPMYRVKRDLMVMLTGPRIPGSRCKIHFKAMCALLVAEFDTKEFLNSFREFEELAIRIEVEPDPELDQWLCVCIQWQKYPAFLRIWKSLESNLGKPEILSAENGYYLLYHPRKHAEASKGVVEV